MKRYCLLFALLVQSYLMLAQGINLGVIVPDYSVENVAPQAYSILESKLENLITNSGGTAENRGTFLLFPVVSIVSDNLIEGGMMNLNSVEIELTAKAISINNNNTYGSISWTLTGKGSNRTEAVKEAFRKISTSDPKFKVFFSDITDKISKYFESNKANLLVQARTLASQQKYEEAIALLYDYPIGVNGYEEIQKEISVIYKQHQTANCKQILQEARSRFALQDFETSLDLLSEIDATSSCANEVKELSEQIRRKINLERKEEKEREVEERKIRADIEKSRINAISNIMSSYYQNRPNVTYYNVSLRRW